MAGSSSGNHAALYANIFTPTTPSVAMRAVSTTNTDSVTAGAVLNTPNAPYFQIQASDVSPGSESTLRVYENNLNYNIGGADVFTVGPTTIVSTVPFLAPAGTAAAPSVGFTGATTTGLYSAAPGIGFAVAGASVGTWTATALTSTVPIVAAPGVQGANSKALTDATATAFVRIAIAQAIATNYEAGKVEYTIYCDDDTKQAVQKGHVNFACHNLAGTETCGFGTPDGVTLGDGTASLSTPTFDATSGAADTIDLRVNSDCTGITPNTHTVQWRISTEATATLTPQ
jgi:hypothetical protein